MGKKKLQGPAWPAWLGLRPYRAVAAVGSLLAPAGSYRAGLVPSRTGLPHMANKLYTVWAHDTQKDRGGSSGLFRGLPGYVAEVPQDTGTVYPSNW